MYKTFIKPTGDFVVASTAFVVLLPLFLLAVLALAIVNNGSVFFLQPRPGLRGNIFRVIKFKTMNDKRGADGELLPDAQRLTTVGHWIRRLSIDEIPQLLNVIKGDMSLVGPRPLLVEYLPLYNAQQARRHLVKPGISGWAQVNGRNALSWESKFALDVWYVDHISFALDLKIVVMTILKVFKQEGISAAGEATMHKFKG